MKIAKLRADIAGHGIEKFYTKPTESGRSTRVSETSEQKEAKEKQKKRQAVDKLKSDVDKKVFNLPDIRGDASYYKYNSQLRLK